MLIENYIDDEKYSASLIYIISSFHLSVCSLMIDMVVSFNQRFIMLHSALKSIRVFHRLSQIELAERLNVSKSYISEIESGKKNATMTIIEKYSEEFDIPMSSIIELSEKMENKNKLPRHKKLILEIINWATKDK
ncbi:TPA: helix-turn-helix domain-containing protein [Vibrio parahaemolyticus]